MSGPQFECLKYLAQWGKEYENLLHHGTVKVLVRRGWAVVEWGRTELLREVKITRLGRAALRKELRREP